MTPCPRCGADVPEGARFCPSCGFNLEGLREERRVVTVLFGDLSGFTEMSEQLDPEQVKSIVDRAFEGLAELVTLYGGRVDKVIGDEIMAVFGAPRSHEDDPERAVRCALGMQTELARFARELEAETGVRLGMRIGINTGEVMAGTVAGGDAYTVMGDAVNVASRIEQGAEPGQVLAGEATYLATSRAIQYREHAPVVAKGKQQPLAVWEAVAERTPPGGGGRATKAPLVGRDEELAVLEALAGIVRRDRRTVVVTLLGDAGLGKTRLASEFARRLEPEGVRVVAGRSLPYGTASPSFAAEEMVRAVLEVDVAAPPDAARQRVQTVVGRLGLSLESERLLGLAGIREKTPVGAGARAEGGTRSLGGTAGPSAAQGPARGTEGLQAAGALFEAVAAREGLLVLLFHELHWAEDTLLDFVAELAERGRRAPLLIVCLARPDLIERRPQWAGRPGSVTLPLEPLPRERAAELLDALLGEHRMHETLREEVLERAGGNPFYLEELVRLLVDRGELGPGASEAVAVPVSVQALVAARLDALPPDAKRIVQAAAVVGEHFWSDAIASTDAGVAGRAVEPALEMLVAKEVVEPVEPSSVGDRAEYRFRQAIEREVAYGSVPKLERARMHSRAAEWLEDAAAAAGLDMVDLVAYHFEHAASLGREVGIEIEGAAAKARDSLERAGHRALGQDAMFTASRFYERTLPFAADDTDRMHLRLHLAEALVGCWRPAQAEEHLRAVIEESARAGDRRAEGKALRLMGDLLRIRGEMEEARRYLDRALEIAKEAGDTLEEVEGLRAHGLADIFEGRISSAALWFRQSLARSRDIGDRRSEGWSLQNLAWANTILGRLDEALDNLDEGTKVFGEIGDIEGAGWCLGIRAWVLLFQGRMTEADELEQQIEALVAESREGVLGMASFGWAIGRVLRAIVSVSRGRLTEAESFARAAVEIFDEADNNWGRAMAAYPLGVVAALRLQLREARRIFEDGIERVRDQLQHTLLGAPLAWVAMLQGRLDEAQAMLVEVAEHAERAEIRWLADASLRWVEGKLWLERGDLARAREVLEGRPRHALYGFASASPGALLAEVLCRQGELAQAEAVARRTIEESGDLPVERMLAQRSLAMALGEAGRGDEALRAVDDAIAMVDETDWEMARVEAWLLRAGLLERLGRDDEAAEARGKARAAVGRFPPGAETECLEQIMR